MLDNPHISLPFRQIVESILRGKTGKRQVKLAREDCMHANDFCFLSDCFYDTHSDRLLVFSPTMAQNAN